MKPTNAEELMLTHEKELDELYDLTEAEYLCKLTATQAERYVQLVELLNRKGVPIEFGIQI